MKPDTIKLTVYLHRVEVFGREYLSTWYQSDLNKYIEQVTDEAEKCIQGLIDVIDSDPQGVLLQPTHRPPIFIKIPSNGSGILLYDRLERQYNGLRKVESIGPYKDSD